MTYDVVCAGVVYLDLTFVGLGSLPRQGEEHWARELALSPGGVANTAIALSRLGLRTAVVGAIGRDLAGRYLRQVLESEGVACRGPETERSAVTVVLPTGEDRALVSHLPDEVKALQQLPGLKSRALVIPVDDVFCAPEGVCVYTLTSHADVRAVARGSSFKLNDSHAVVANEAEAIALTGMPDAAASAVDLSQHADTAVVTLGPRGALAASRGTIVQVPAPAAQVCDTTGAGDLFVAAYVWADMAGLDVRARLQWATLYASRSLSTVTAFAGALSLRQLLDEGKQLGFTLP